jgi:hypothetical protein
MAALALTDWPVGGISRDHAVHIAYLRAARRAGAEVSYVSPGDVAKRDRWVCSACGGPVASSWTAAEPAAAPAFAFTVPLGEGGAYVKRNVRLVHYGCVPAGGRQLGRMLRHALTSSPPSVKVKASGRDTHCTEGHDLAGDNLLRSSDGRRRCRQCRRDRERATA